MFTGWAADLAAKRPAESFLLLADGREVFRSGANGVRPQRTLGQKVPRKEYSFEFALPTSLLPDAAWPTRALLCDPRPRRVGASLRSVPYPWSGTG